MAFKSLALAALLASFSLPSAFADHLRNSGVQLHVVDVRNSVGQSLDRPRELRVARLILSLIDQDGKAVGPADLSVTHEKLLHLFAWDEGLTNYRHVHPEPVEGEPGLWEVDVVFPQVGHYRLWADFALASGNEAQADTSIEVEGASSPNLPLESLNPRYSASDQGSILTIEGAESLRAKHLAMLTLRFSREDGTELVITPYLGALAHLVITDLKSNELVHSHPMEMDGELMIHTVFPRAGDYRVFAQFIDGGVLRTVELSVRVR